MSEASDLSAALAVVSELASENSHIRRSLELSLSDAFEAHGKTRDDAHNMATLALHTLLS